MPPTIKPGTKKDQAQGELGEVAQNEGIIAPGMFPIAVRDVHTPIKSPRLERGKCKTEEEEHYFITFGSSQCAKKGVSACLYEQKGWDMESLKLWHYVAAAELGCIKPLVGTGQANSLPQCMSGLRRRCYSRIVGALGHDTSDCKCTWVQFGSQSSWNMVHWSWKHVHQFAVCFQ